MAIQDRVAEVLRELPAGVRLVVAAKGRSAAEVLAAVEAGAPVVGENYLQEGEAHFALVGNRAEWHFIGHLQKKKVKKAVTFFDLIETVDSLELAAEIEKRAAALTKVMSVLIEVNSGREPQKFGLFPEEVEGLVRQLTVFSHLKVLGLMTMGPVVAHPEGLRPYFRLTRELFDYLSSRKIPGVEMRYLSMGMSDSYQLAIAEGANLIRLGTKIFGPRQKQI